MKKVTIDNCLAAKFPKVAVEWHPTKNGKITPKDVLGGSDYKYWFLCKNGHEWESSLNNRIRSNGCPQLVSNILAVSISSVILVHQFNGYCTMGAIMLSRKILMVITA